MLSHEMICEKIKTIVSDFPIKKVSYFGSYADGTATDASDLDILVEFETSAISLLTLLDIKYRLEEKMGISVDVVHAPIPVGSLIEIGKEISVYAA
jgi:predicted nucleotidyltransferase